MSNDDKQNNKAHTSSLIKKAVSAERTFTHKIAFPVLIIVILIFGVGKAIGLENAGYLIIALLIGLIIWKIRAIKRAKKNEN